MADFDFLAGLGFSESELKDPENAYSRLLLEIGEQVTEDFKQYINNKVHNTGALAQSVVFFPTGELSFQIQADDYYKFQDEGVNPIGQNIFPTNYQFKLPFVTKRHAIAIKEWKGYDMSHAYASASATKNRHGIKPKNITINVMTDEVLERISNDLAAVTGLMFEVKFTENTKTWR